jgi:hypothetical protein
MSDDEWTTCHFCGTETNALGFEYNGKRHWLEDCRPDLVEHDEGPLCTWPPYTEEKYLYLNDEHPRPGCYAFQDRASLEWGTEHIHFYPKESNV